MSEEDIKRKVKKATTEILACTDEIHTNSERLREIILSCNDTMMFLNRFYKSSRDESLYSLMLMLETIKVNAENTVEDFQNGQPERMDSRVSKIKETAQSLLNSSENFKLS